MNNNNCVITINNFIVNLHSLNTEDEVFYCLIDTINLAFNTDSAVVYRYNPHNKKPYQQVTNSTLSDGFSDNTRAASDTDSIEIVAKTKKPFYMESTTSFQSAVTTEQVHYMQFTTPILVGKELVGIINLHQINSTFDKQYQEDFLSLCASTASTRIHHIRTVKNFEKTIQQLKKSNCVQDVLFKMAELSHSAFDLNEFYAELHQLVKKILYAKNFYIALIADQGNSIFIPYFKDEADKVLKDEVVKLDTDMPSITSYVIQSNTPLLVNRMQIETLVAEKKFKVIGSLPESWLGTTFGNDNMRGAVVIQSYSEQHTFHDKDEKLLSYVAEHIRNAIERMQKKSDLQFLALHDALTKLPNRSLFIDRTWQALNHQPLKPFSILFFDLDHFKYVNDNFGHHIGDELLIKISTAMRSCIKNIDTLCRLGGDEFVLLIQDISCEKNLYDLTARMVKAANTPFVIEGHELKVSISLGVTCHVSGQTTPEILLKEADQAMYKAKLSGKNQVFFYHNLPREYEAQPLPVLEKASG